MATARALSRGLGAMLTALTITGCAAIPTDGADRKALATRVEPARPGETVLALGSCLRQGRRRAPQLDEIVRVGPEALLMVGDNAYIDQPRRPRNRWDFRRKYDELAARGYWQRLTAAVPIVATWDDHDFGKNDADGRWYLKGAAKDEFMRFFGVADDHPMRDRDGVYHAVEFGEPGRRVRVMMLDTRWFRDAKARPKEMLGEAQWAWLEAELRKPAEVRLIASSVQVLSDKRNGQGWSDYPEERQRLFDLIRDTEARGVVLLSGDRHFAEITRRDDDATPYPLWDVTSSGLNERTARLSEKNPRRVGSAKKAANFALLRFDGSARPATVTLELVGPGGVVFNRQVVSLDELRPEARRVSIGLARRDAVARSGRPGL